MPYQYDLRLKAPASLQIVRRIALLIGAAQRDQLRTTCGGLGSTDETACTPPSFCD